MHSKQFVWSEVKSLLTILIFIDYSLFSKLKVDVITHDMEGNKTKQTNNNNNNNNNKTSVAKLARQQKSKG